MALISAKKLPKQAQRRIEALEREVESWKAKALAATTEGVKGTNVLIAGILDPDRGLPPDSVIRFRVGISVFEVRHERSGGAISVRSVHGCIAILPAAANVVHIRSQE